MPKPPVTDASDDSEGIAEFAEAEPLRLPSELNRATWQRVSRRLLAKMIAEFAYEEIVQPVPRSAATLGTSAPVPSAPAPSAAPSAPAPAPAVGHCAGHSAAAPYVLRLDDAAPAEGGAEGGADGGADSGGGTLSFLARRGAYGSWWVDEASVAWDVPPVPEPTDDSVNPMEFLIRARGLLGLDGATLGHLVRELGTTLNADARLDHTALPASDLADLDYAELEGHQTGHPWIVFNKGRMGFSASDTRHWAPEARCPRPLPWIAVRRGLATYRGVPELGDPNRLYAHELDHDVRAAFAAALDARGLCPGDYLYLPVHPWQWDEIVVPLFAAGIAAHDIVPLPPADRDLRLPQQSIRTFLNVSRPGRHSVKLPLSILNTLVWRGLPTRLTKAAPAVTGWVRGLCESDAFLRDDCRVILLGEVASVAVGHEVYDRLPEAPYQYKELLGAIWREPLARHLVPGERARTLAALLHTDSRGRAFVAELVERSGMPPRDWLRLLFKALLPPLLHFLYRYGTVFSPHGENTVIVFDGNDVPARMAVKDFVDDINVSAVPVPEHATMPEEVRDVLLTEPPGFLTQFIHSGLFVGVFRYLAPLCEGQLGIPEADFWAMVRDEIVRHHERFPELKERFETFDLLTERIERLCLNRNRLHLDGYRDRPTRPHAAVHGTVPNPLHQG
ncbi:IucA/IucC family protein [Streptomyces sp. SAJ15]|uniref:IucA/IucC family protein n=1 Tax=Streptomyces sp. SAJ15 TaxID=2011095 RepID=UPI0037D9D83D